ncbi:MAG TPA: hypothetical protein VMU45_12545 [Candidatus Eisenbacteria bacterium]|nr:hypothetical protein [Candidatus Eisenbacteria bacterium]
MPYRTCDHLMEDGVYCSSPALRDQRYCHFHLNARARRVQAARARLHGDSRRFQMPILDNMHAVQAGIQQVLDALADDRIQNRRAGLLLYALQQAAASLKTTPGWQGQRPQLKPGEPLSALEVRSLQEQYDLPFDTDLEAPPDVAAAEIDATVALPMDARRGQTEQQVLARVPARPESPAGNNALRGSGEKHSEVPVHDLRRDPQPVPDAVLKSPPLSHPAPLTTPANAA